MSGVQFDLEYDNTALTLATTIGDALRQSGKSVYTADLAPNRKRVLIAGLNRSPIPDGTLFNLFINISLAAPQGSYPLKFSAITGTDPNGMSTPVLGTAGTITVSASGTVTNLQPNAVVNAASFVAGPVAPGEIITLIGSGIGPLRTQSAASTSVLFDGTAAPLLYVSPNQINAVVPYEVYLKSKTGLEVTFQQHKIAAASLKVDSASPAIFTVDSSGSGQGAIINQDSTPNSPDNPAKKGSVVAIFATGAGQTDPGGKDGAITGTVLSKPLLRVSVRIGGVDAPVQYAGAAPGLISGVLQVNAKIPQGVTSGAAVPIELIIGDANSPAGVSVAIK